MKRIVSIGLALLVVSMIGLGAIGAVAAQTPEETAAPDVTESPVPGTGKGLGRAWDHVRMGARVVSDAVAVLLGLTQDEIQTKRVDGQTWSEIAAEQGVTDQELIDAMLSEKVQLIEQAVTDGNLTQAQADWLIAREKALTPFQITNPFATGRMRDMFNGRMGDRAGDRIGGRLPRGGMRGGALEGHTPGACPSVTPEAEAGSST